MQIIVRKEISVVIKFNSYPPQLFILQNFK